MKDKTIIVVGILMAIFGAFMIVGNMPITVEDFEGDLKVDGNLNVTGTGEFGGNVTIFEMIIFDTGDFIDYDEANDRYLFYIGDVVVGFVNATGFHDGAP